LHHHISGVLFPLAWTKLCPLAVDLHTPLCNSFIYLSVVIWLRFYLNNLIHKFQSTQQINNMFIANNKLTIYLLRHVSTHMSHHQAFSLNHIRLQRNCAHLGSQGLTKLLDNLIVI
jgi:hypothetical protein